MAHNLIIKTRADYLIGGDQSLRTAVFEYQKHKELSFIDEPYLGLVVDLSTEMYLQTWSQRVSGIKENKSYYSE